MSQAGATNLVAEVEDETAGFLVLEVERGARLATLVTLDVAEPYRNAGVGSLLLDHSEQILREGNIRLYRLQVDTSNESAIAFYRKHGFQTRRTLKRYYGNGANAYLMEKKFSSQLSVVSCH